MQFLQDALRELVGTVLKSEETLYCTSDGQKITAGQMLQWMEQGDVKAKEFMNSAARSIIIAMANEAQLREEAKSK